MTYTLGVDLGTTFSAAAVHRDGTTEIVALAHRAMVVPSAVLVTADGEVLVGDAALRRGTTEPGRLAREFKRLLGDPVPVLVGGEPYTAEALTALLLERLVAGVSEQQGGPPERVVLTFPANWGPHKQGLLAEAARLAHVDQGFTVTEPEAAAIWYQSAERIAPGETVAVYDLGGGTFDAAVLRKTDTGFEVLGTPHGIERLGGIDADEAVFRHVCQVLDLDFKSLAADENARRALVRLRAECVDAKEALSADTTATIPVALPDLHRDVRLTRLELEAMVRPVLEDSIQALRQAIDSAGLTTDDIDRVLLVGGSSRMPIVADLVTGALGRPFFVDAHPKHVVALGAALAAAAPEQAGARPVGLPPPERADPSAPETTQPPEAPAPTVTSAPATTPPAEIPDLAASLEPPSLPESPPVPGLTEPEAEPTQPEPSTLAESELGSGVMAPPAPPRTADEAEEPELEAATTGDTSNKRWRWAAVPVVVLLVGAAIMVSRGGGNGSSGSSTETTRPIVEGVRGGELVVDLTHPQFGTGVPPSIDPAMISTPTGALITEALYDGLTGIDIREPEAPVVVPKVAASYEPNEDATVWTFTLHEGLRFSDGTDVLPSSFVLGWERASTPGLTEDNVVFELIEGGQEKLAGDADQISGLQADDEEMTLTVTLEDPFASFDALVSHPLFMPMPEAVRAFEDEPDTWDDGDMIGNGPYQLDGPPSDDEVVLVRNPAWDGELYDVRLHLPPEAFLDKITFRASADETAAYDAFEDGNRDVVAVPYDSLEDADEAHNTTFDGAASNVLLQVGWSDPVIGGPDNRLLRQAVAQAIDRDRINEVLAKGTAQVASGLITPRTPGFTPGLCDLCTFDRAAAEAALQDWKDEGNELAAPIRVQAPTAAAVATIVEDLQAIGIDAIEDPLGEDTYIGQLREGGACQLCLVLAGSPYPAHDALMLDLFHSSYGTSNLGAFEVEELDQLLDEALASVEETERTGILQDAESLVLNEEIATIPLLWQPYPYAYSGRVATLPQTGTGHIVWERVYVDG